MKMVTKLVICALFSLSIGFVAATPLLVSDLSMTPFIEHIQGPTADQIIEIEYAKFTVINESTPITQYSGPIIAYYVVLRVTNPSNMGSQVLDVNFVAASSNISSSSSLFTNGATGQGYTLEGAWVNDKWYNVTWAASLPTIDEKGQIISTSSDSNFTGYWMQGIQLDDVYVNGSLAYTYMNMNGTWTDVTKGVNFTHPPPIGFSDQAGSLNSTILSAHYVFVDELPTNANTDESAPFATKYIAAGAGKFDRSWAPNESRLILLSGTYDVRQPFVNASEFTALKSGNIVVKTQIMNVADGMSSVNNTIIDTSSVHTEQKRISLIKDGDSYIYNAIIENNQVFEEDKWGLEVFIK